ncbi:MAG TPA: protein-L-isoaspartate O-methyltransferase [Candidatus Nanoarchaeia archaeon]|nr:protein-L-isoaspartate O-methyltransferase [Candidatus Nanoarchaeia archaeon]
MDKSQLIESLKMRGFSKEIISSFEKVRREDFVPEDMKKIAYEDTSLPIGEGQTISQPYTIAVMLSLLDLKKGQKILEIGSGCGYVLALVSELIGKGEKVYGIEIIKSLFEKSAENLRNYKNIKVYNRNGFLGLEEEAPFDRIILSAGYREIPKPLITQLKDGGIIVAPIGTSYEQALMAFEKNNEKLEMKKEIKGFIFVPLVEKQS